MRVGDPYSIVARMEDCLTRELACFSGIRETLEAFIALLKTSDDDESALDGLSDKLSRSGLNTDDLAAEYTILKKEWDGVKSELDVADRDLIFATLKACGDNKTQAVGMLDISVRTLRNKLNEYGK